VPDRWLPIRGRDSKRGSHHVVQTGPGAHPVGAGDSLPGIEATGTSS
jgi:hypothetical protein